MTWISADTRILFLRVQVRPSPNCRFAASTSPDCLQILLPRATPRAGQGGRRSCDATWESPRPRQGAREWGSRAFASLEHLQCERSLPGEPWRASNRWASLESPPGPVADSRTTLKPRRIENVGYEWVPGLERLVSGCVIHPTHDQAA
jgi:hypothetical protein